MTGAVVIVDYGVGNLMSVQRGVEQAGGSAQLASRAEAIRRADRLILPGVGAFADCRNALEQDGLLEAVREFLQSGRPALGICVGMQLLFDRSFEFGETPGLGVLPGEVKHLSALAPTVEPVKIPRVGWCRLAPPSGRPSEFWDGSILSPTEPAPDVYFVHSYGADPENDDDVLAVADFAGTPICAAVRRGNLFATQFHPEKSGAAGIAMLRRFLAR